MATRKQIPLIPTDSELAITDAKTVSFGCNFTHTGADVEVIGSGSAEITFPSSSDTVLGRASIDSITGLKTFDSTKIAIKGSSTGITSIASANDGATDYTATLPAKDGTVAMTSDIPSIGSWGVLNYPTWATGTPFVKMTAAGTFALDTSTYLTSLSGAVLTDQTSGQTIGDTTNRLTKLWATDITCTNAITGSVTGNAGTVTNATLTTAFTNNGGAGTLTWPAAGATLTIPTGGGTLGTGAFATIANYAPVGQTFYIGTTQVAINRASAALTLAGITLTTPDIGTPSAGTLTNCTGLPIAGLVNSTSTALGVGSIELGNASDTTISRSAAGVIAVESVVIPSISSTNTLTNKRITPRVYSTTTASSVTPAIGTYDRYFYTALSQAITLNAPSATPTAGEILAIYLTDNGTARAITWNATYKALGAALPTTTVVNKTLEIIATYNGTDWLTTTGQLV